MNPEDQQAILNLPFVRKAIEDAEVIGTERLGYIKRYEQMKLQEIDDLVNKKLGELLSIVDPKQVVTFDKRTGIIYVGGERLSDSRLKSLKSEADFFAESELWKIVHETPKELAHRTMFVDSESLDDLKKGKSILYTLDSQKKIIDVFRSYTPKKKTVV